MRKVELRLLTKIECRNRDLSKVGNTFSLPVRKMRKHTCFVTSFLKENGTQDLLDKWLSSDTQEKWRKIYVMKPSQKKKRCTCYILFCIDKRESVKSLNTTKSPSEITSILATKWKSHKNAKDETYHYYKNLYRKQVFYDQARQKLADKYYHLPVEEINILIEKMYTRAFKDL